MVKEHRKIFFRVSAFALTLVFAFSLVSVFQQAQALAPATGQGLWTLLTMLLGLAGYNMEPWEPGWSSPDPPLIDGQLRFNANNIAREQTAQMWRDMSVSFVPQEGSWAMDWWENFVKPLGQGSGSLHAGDSIKFPGEAIAWARQWAESTFNFQAGSYVVTQDGVTVDGDVMVMFSAPVTTGTSSQVATSVGTVFGHGESISIGGHTYTWYNEIESGDFGYRAVYGWDLRDALGAVQRVYMHNWGSWQMLSVAEARYRDNQQYSGVVGLNSYFSTQYLLPALMYESGGSARVDGYYSRSVVEGAERNRWLFAPESIQTGAVKLRRNTLGVVRPDEVVTAYVPHVAIVGGVPDLVSITGEQVLSTPQVTAEPTAEPTAMPTAIPGTWEAIGEMELTELQNSGLGGMMITKFPFSIPWDVAKSVQLLAAPPVPPRWEVDFLAPLSGKVGGWKGDTTVVLEFSQFETIAGFMRWLLTIGFCCSLAIGTKRLLWTA